MIESSSKKKCNIKNMVTLFLMTEKGYEFLRCVANDFKSIFSVVVVGNDKSIQKDYEDEIIEFCIKNSIKYVKKADFKNVESEYALAISWRWLIKHPSDKLIVFHDSLLPKYRGFAPLVNSLINGEREIGVTAIFGSDDFDTGDIVAQSKSTIEYPIRINDAIRLNNKNYMNCARIVLDKLINNELIVGKSQDNSASSYSVWRDEEDYNIDWSKPAVEIRRLIDALGYPYKGASTMCDGKKIRIFNSEECSDVYIENRDCGKVLFMSEGKPIVICGEGLLKITDAMIDELENATSLFPLTRFRLRFGKQ